MGGFIKGKKRENRSFNQNKRRSYWKRKIRIWWNVKRKWRSNKDETISLVEYVYTKLQKLTDNPYIETLEVALNVMNDKQLSEALTILIDEIARSYSQRKDGEFDLQDHFRRKYLKEKLNQVGLFGVYFQDADYIIYQETLKELIENYGLEDQYFKNADSYILKIKANMGVHTLKHTK